MWEIGGIGGDVIEENRHLKGKLPFAGSFAAKKYTKRLSLQSAD